MGQQGRDTTLRPAARNKSLMTNARALGGQEGVMESSIAGTPPHLTHKPLGKSCERSP